jgi:hypothetical protein
MNEYSASLIEIIALDMLSRETHYQSIEATHPQDPLSDSQLDKMNASLGFKGRVKGNEYRPYCMGHYCRAPRMHRIESGFKCHLCGNTWHL